jgi:Fuc2NAc and GlcNAc transferase
VQPFITLAVAAALSVLLTGLMFSVARSAKLIDVPNERSSHTVPTPRGGGVAIVLTFLAGLLVLQWQGPLPAARFDGLLLAAALVAAIGFADDRWQLRASKRLAGHIVAAAWLLWHLGSMPPLTLLGHPVDLGWAGPPLAMLYLVWAINFFNFMDGIDGIASLEAITVALGGAVLNLLVLGADSWVLPALLACCCAGFLVWNWPPARIFMGDAGSGFLGLVVGGLTLGSAFQAPVLFWGWAILQGCFMVDATTTLLRRVYRGERAMQPHRTHAYQYWSRVCRSHRRVTLSYAAITGLWLFPLAVGVVLGWLDGLVGLAVAYGPLIGLAYHFHAGAREHQTT